MEATDPQVEEKCIASGEASTADEFQTLYVLVYPSPLFAAHWSLWLPHSGASGEASDVGDRIHATGDRLNGFQYEYLQDYNAKEDSRRPKSFAIGHVSGSITHTSRDVIAEGVVDSGSGTDQAALNPFDQACRKVPVPGPNLNRVAPGSATGPAPKKLEVKDCQWWIKQVVAHLVEAGILFPLKGEGSRAVTPDERIEMLPKH